jgi:ABC-2 type transport system ATP-binding protein
MSDPVLSFDDVTRRFGRTLALDRVTLAVEPGSVVGLLGRNGAGKTTALRLAHGQLHPDAGRIRTLGRDPVRDGRAVRERTSLLAEETALFPWMTVAELLAFARALHPRWEDGVARRTAERLDLDPGPRVRELSRGGKAKVALVVAVASRPELLLLDDPTAGLDPLVRREVLEGVLDAVPSDGGAVVYASHLVHDVERVADRVVVLDRGRIVLDGALDELKSSVRKTVAIFESAPRPPAGLVAALDVTVDGRVLTAVGRTDDGEPARSLAAAGATHVRVEPLSLEEILVACLRGGRAPEGADDEERTGA